MDQATFQAYRSLIYNQAGINLQPGKEALVSARVAKRARALGLADERAYLAHAQADPTGDEMVHLLDAISTNVTYFFREPAHFELLAEELEGLLAAGQRRIRLWSAACSTGEEPYTMAMTALDALARRGGSAASADLKILATDLSTRVLAHARQAKYSVEKLAQVPAECRGRHVLVESRAGVGTLSPEARHLVTFRRLNLSDPPFPMQGSFDVVFCRNVMIYFDQAVRARLVREITRLLRPDGLLLIGHSENLLGVQPEGLRTVRPSVYRKAGPLVAVRPGTAGAATRREAAR